MHSDFDAPGHKVRRNHDGTKRSYWVARADLVARGDEPKTVRLHYDVHNPEQRPLIEAACRKLQAEMLEWSAGRKQDGRRFDGTILSLSRRYQADSASPHHIRNMDARAGGISEADDAAADLDAIRSAAGHSQASTTARYVRGTGGKARKVAELRLAHRKAREQDVNRR